VKKKTIAYALLCLLLASALGLEVVNLVNANFEPAPLFIIKDKPIITILSPLNGTIQKNTQVIFNVSFPDAWGNWVQKTAWNGTWDNMGTIHDVTCTLDETVIFYNDTAYGKQAQYPFMWFNVRNIVYSKNVGALALGQHILTIAIEADTLYYDAGYKNYDVSTNETYTFVIVDPPSVASLSVQNTTYNKSYLPLIFTINETPLWSGYSWLGLNLDNKANATVYGNVTLTDLTEGNHSIIIYANDTFGNMGKSDTIFFSVLLPTPTPSSTPSPSLSKVPTLEPSITSNPIIDSNNTLVILVIGTTILILTFGLAFYFRKKRK
jgi:hypothetical protein